MAERTAAARLKNERTERWLVSTLGQPLLDGCRQYAASGRKSPDSNTEDPVALEGALKEAFRRNGLPLQHLNPAHGFVLTQYYHLVALAAFKAAKSDGSS